MTAVHRSIALAASLTLALLSVPAQASPSCSSPSNCERSMEDILRQMESQNRDMARKIDDLQRKLDELKSQTSAASSQSSRALDETLHRRLKRLGEGAESSGNGFNSLFTACEPGSFMVGLRRPSDQADANSIAKYTVICRTLRID